MKKLSLGRKTVVVCVLVLFTGCISQVIKDVRGIGEAFAKSKEAQAAGDFEAALKEGKKAAELCMVLHQKKVATGMSMEQIDQAMATSLSPEDFKKYKEVKEICDPTTGNLLKAVSEIKQELISSPQLNHSQKQQLRLANQILEILAKIALAEAVSEAARLSDPIADESLISTDSDANATDITVSLD